MTPDYAWQEVVASVPFVLVGGLLGDRIPIRFTLAGCGLAQGGAIAALATGSLTGLFHILMGAIVGGRMAPGIVVYGAYFGRRNFATIIAVSFLATGVMQILAMNGVQRGLVEIAMATDSPTVSPVIALIISAISAALYLLVGSPHLSPSQQQGNDGGPNQPPERPAC